MKNQKVARDNYGVPKDVNLQVLKVLYYMNEHGHKSPHIYEIFELVEMTMPNTIAICDMPTMVYKSLQNMAKLGVIAKRGKSFYIRSLKFKPFTPPPVVPKIFRMKERQHAISRMDPNLRRLRHTSEESGNEIDKARKRCHPRKSQQALLAGTEESPKDLNVDLVEKASLSEEAKIDGTPKTSVKSVTKSRKPSRYNGLQVYNLKGEKITLPGIRKLGLGGTTPWITFLQTDFSPRHPIMKWIHRNHKTIYQTLQKLKKTPNNDTPKVKLMIKIQKRRRIPRLMTEEKLVQSIKDNIRRESNRKPQANTKQPR